MHNLSEEQKSYQLIEIAVKINWKTQKYLPAWGSFYELVLAIRVCCQ